MSAAIKLLGVFPVRTVVSELAEMFRQETGNTVTLSFNASGGIREKLAAGDPVDVIILNDYEIDELIAEGAVVTGTRTDIARFGLGVVVRRGAPLPDISTSESLKQTLLSAKSIIYGNPERVRGGAHFAGVLERLGIGEAVKGKTILSSGGPASSEAVAAGKAELGVQGLSKSIVVEGASIVGPLPKGLQKIMTLSAGLATRSAAPEAALDFVSFLARPSFRSKFAEQGLDSQQ